MYQRLGEGMGRIVAFIASSTLTSAEGIIYQVGLLVPSYMIPKQIRFLASLPRNANGKIDRNSLKEMLT